jgi:hypothetical protein
VTKQQLLHYLAHRVPVVSADFDFRFTDAQMHRCTELHKQEFLKIEC